MTTETETTIATLAQEAYDWFERRQRGDTDDWFYALKDGRPEWVFDLVWAAHDDGDFLPDDWRYDCIHSALGHIADNDGDEDASEFADSQVDVYNGARFAWLASHLQRQFYVDAATEEFGPPDDASVTAQIGMGQYLEATQVFQQVYQTLEERLEQIEDEA